ncbi:hypothetical protein CC1G_04299 [Coprinopsis cinerea okayama7|uniref:Aprataxin C2HE/C2H2/C2HC zinc finger domain-containing protein n=1 Tax=Coprinopsis cinerea (strain Okayama-7 / 130 / ATCC MYA-4618 / FGSC 9003) TaxID=240176 RepID=A8NFM1_COPC7|nr:hypothetical protein CC1G_04299 [Coprinopsis cinerea okayama7\|eukprot:XP_001833320.2 hypothetical protein CC1G_04299 [Coprinopsis cinerea okayama7\
MPSSLPNAVLFQSSDKYLTIFDAYPKSIFHFLILPRIEDGAVAGEESQGKFSVQELRNLKALLRTSDKQKAKKLIEELKSEADSVKRQIEEEMVERYGFKWGVWVGFHAVPSMEHLHLHVLSADLVSEKMKKKKHYNSFHPSLGFFLHIDDVLEWFESTPEYFEQVTELNPKKYESLLKDSLACFTCGSAMKNIPTLKVHLQEEWDKLEKKFKRPAVKRKMVEHPVEDQVEGAREGRSEVGDDENPSKKAKKDGQ